MWLWDVLLKAEEANEKVHIIGHSPPNTNEFVSGWAKQYTKLIDRKVNYSNAIFWQLKLHFRRALQITVNVIIIL